MDKWLDLLGRDIIIFSTSRLVVWLKKKEFWIDKSERYCYGIIPDELFACKKLSMWLPTLKNGH